jgi:hypothetical protein
MVPTLDAAIDACVAEFLEDEGQTYEVGCRVASVADLHVDTDTGGGSTATLIRDVFHTWTSRIESFTGRSDDLPAALRAHSDIADALRDWNEGGREDVTGFALRLHQRVGVLDAPSPYTSGAPFVRRSRLRTWFDRRHRGS